MHLKYLSSFSLSTSIDDSAFILFAILKIVSLSLLLKFYNHNEIHGNNKVHFDADEERYICLLSGLCLGNKFTDQQEKKLYKLGASLGTCNERTINI